MKFLRKRSLIAAILCFKAQLVCGQTVESTSQADVAASNLPPAFLDVFAGPIAVKTDFKREVDKKGATLGVGLHGRWDFSDAYVTTGVGYLTANVKGSSALTVGDQTAQIASTFLDVNGGYRVTSSLSAALGLQSWLGEGSDFAPKTDAQKNKIYYYADVNFDPRLAQPILLHVRYTKDLNIADRDISMLTMGAQYKLPL